MDYPIATGHKSRLSGYAGLELLTHVVSVIDEDEREDECKSAFSIVLSSSFSNIPSGLPQIAPTTTTSAHHFPPSRASQRARSLIACLRLAEELQKEDPLAFGGYMCAPRPHVADGGHGLEKAQYHPQQQYPHG